MIREVLPGGSINFGTCKEWLYLWSGAGEPAFNMAVDETLLENASQISCPILRVYIWSRPAVSIGYLQSCRVVGAELDRRVVIRRPTGGGVVYHGPDWTYTIVIPPNHWWYNLKALESYKLLHSWIQGAFNRMGIETVLAPEACRAGERGKCFVGYEQYDLLFKGRKIAGAAQRRNRQGLLIQGSIVPPFPHLDVHQWAANLKEVGVELFNAKWIDWSLGENLLARVQALVQEKYASERFTFRK